jgi:hypothetical protein
MADNQFWELAENGRLVSLLLRDPDVEALADTRVDAPGLHVQVVGADAAPLSPAEVARLFPRVRPMSPRFDRLARAARVVVTSDGRLVGMAVYQRADTELRVPDLGLASSHTCGGHEVLNALLDALEAACLAGGQRRLVLTPPVKAHALLRRRGYELISEGCAGTWMEKTFR